MEDEWEKVGTRHWDFTDLHKEPGARRPLKILSQEVP